MNIYIFYEINLFYLQGAHFTSENYLFGAFKLTEITDPDQYSFAEYGIGYDAGQSFLLSDGSGFGKNVITFGTGMSSYVHIDNKK